MNVWLQISGHPVPDFRPGARGPPQGEARRLGSQLSILLDTFREVQVPSPYLQGPKTHTFGTQKFGLSALLGLGGRGAPHPTARRGVDKALASAGLGSQHRLSSPPHSRWLHRLEALIRRGDVGPRWAARPRSHRPGPPAARSRLPWPEQG